MRTLSLISLIFCAFTAHAYTLEEQVKGAQAVGGLCKNYAEMSNLDASRYISFNIQTLKIAEQLGYSDNMARYTQDVASLEIQLNQKLMEKYGSPEVIYNDYCNKFYESFTKQIKTR